VLRRRHGSFREQEKKTRLESGTSWSRWGWVRWRLVSLMRQQQQPRDREAVREILDPRCSIPQGQQILMLRCVAPQWIHQCFSTNGGRAGLPEESRLEHFLVLCGGGGSAAVPPNNSHIRGRCADETDAPTSGIKWFCRKLGVDEGSSRIATGTTRELRVDDRKDFSRPLSIKGITTSAQCR
jgi:hypothetical protein